MMLYHLESHTVLHCLLSVHRSITTVHYYYSKGNIIFTIDPMNLYIMISGSEKSSSSANVFMASSNKSLLNKLEFSTLNEHYKYILNEA